ncbi:MAG: HAMP domain-containing histidine kinase [Gammaproteobacteria bacterium]|jgi:two-component system sensor histidine kinase RegB|nr:MAG: HAMP domain-containing histidine kinase [Gammaproteobacteria bacterium]
MIDSLTRVIQASLLQLRWLSVTAMVLGALVSPLLLGPSDLMIRLLVYAGVVSLVNLGFQLADSTLGAAEAPRFFSPCVQLSFDLLAWGGYIFLSGGATNPLISLFLPLVAIGALILTPRQAWLLALGAILIYSFLWYFYVPLHIADFARAGTLHLFGMWLVFALSAVLVVGFILQLSSGIRRRDRELTAAREQAIRDDWLITLGSQAAGAAHELGTPLASLNVLADDLLDDGRLPPALAADVQAMKTEIRRCKETLSQLTARAAQALVGQAPTQPAVDWLRRLLEVWQSRHPALAVAWNLGRNLNDHLLPADVALEQALTHLLDNARKAGASRIQVRADVERDWLVVGIQDDGRGMPPAALDAFARRQPPDSAGGLGVGLLLGRAAIERRGGSLTFNAVGGGSAEGRGTLVELRLPLAATATDDEAPPTHSTEVRHGG